MYGRSGRNGCMKMEGNEGGCKISMAAALLLLTHHILAPSSAPLRALREPRI
jgi:hypothetical protein